MNNTELEFRPFRELSPEQLHEIGRSWANPINARYNEMRDPYGSAIELAGLDEPTFSNKDDYYDNMYYRAVFKKGTEELIGTCRFGCDEVWDFGFNILLKHWFEGYGVKILQHIIEVERAHGATRIRGGADIENFGSYKSMVKCGFVMSKDLDKDGDFEYWLEDVQNHIMPTSDEIEKNWKHHLKRANEEFGTVKLNGTDEKRISVELSNVRMLGLGDINKLVSTLVQGIKAGGDEDILTLEYWAKIKYISDLLADFKERIENGEDDSRLKKEYLHKVEAILKEGERL